MSCKSCTKLRRSNQSLDDRNHHQMVTINTLRREVRNRLDDGHHVAEVIFNLTQELAAAKTGWLRAENTVVRYKDKYGELP